MAETTDLRRLLVLHGPSLEASGILGFLQEHFQTHLTQNLDEALDAMRSERVDAVLADTGDFLPLERGIVTQHASVVLETLGDGVCIVGAGGELVWANRRMREAPRSVLDPLREICAEAYEQFAMSSARRDGARGQRFSLMPDDGRYFEVICSPVHDGQGLLRQVVAVVIDATSQRRQQLKLNAIERAGRELVRLDGDVARRDAIERHRLLTERIISCSREVLQYEHFAVMVLDEGANRLEPLIFEGLDAQAEEFHLFASTQSNGICGYVAATGQSYLCPDVRRDPRYVPAWEDARSSLTVPLHLHDRVVGVLNVESNSPAAFGEEDRQFAEIFAHYVAIALNVLDLLVRRHQTTRNELSGALCGELTGPLNDIITELTEIVEDYIGHDDLRRRLGEVIESAGHARRIVREVSESPRTGVLFTPSAPEEPDPLLASKRVLVADDETLIRQTIRDVLVSHGCEVDTARDGTEAIERIRALRYDLVISDIKMPGATGYEVYSAARSADKTTQIILVTAFGYDPSHSVVQAGREGLSAVLSKPFKVKQLLDRCRLALRGETE